MRRRKEKGIGDTGAQVSGLFACGLLFLFSRAVLPELLLTARETSAGGKGGIPDGFAGALLFASLLLAALESARLTLVARARALSEGRRIRVMPDAHSNGDGSVTGFTMTLAEPVILALEYGSGCGVSCAKLNETGIDLQKLDAVCHEIPAGRNLLFEPAFPFDFSRLCCYDRLKRYYEWPNSLGTLGGGNHFIELDRGADGSHYLVRLFSV